MTRKWIKRIAIAVLAMFVFLVAVHFVLRVVSGTEWATRQAREKLAAITGRDVRLGRLDLGLNRFSVEEFELAKEGGFERGTDVRINRLYLKVSWLHLLWGNIKIVAIRLDGLVLHVVRNAQGKLNFDFSEGTEEPAPKETDKKISFPLGLHAEELSLNHTHVSYKDEAEKSHIGLKDAALSVRNFSLDKPFEARFSGSVLAQANGQEQTFALQMSSKINLADLDFAKAQATLKDFSLRAGASRLHLTGNVNNFVDPVFSLRATGKDLSQEVLKPFVKDSTEFVLSQATLEAQGAVAPSDEAWRVDMASLVLVGLEMSGKGNGNWGRGTYSFEATGKAVLDEWGKQLALLKPYKLNGKLSAQTKGDQKEISLQMDLKDGGGTFAQTGKFSQVVASFKGQGRLDGKRGEGALEFVGKLNEEPFETHTVLSQTPSRITLGLKAAADRLVLPSMPASSASVQEEPAKPEEKSNGAFPPLDINADVQIGSLDVPYLNGHDLRFKTDLTGVTAKLNDAHGKFDFSIGNGTITDLYQLTNSNPLAKVLFLSLSVVGKVFNSLDVLSVLGGIAGSGKDSEGGEEVVQMIPGEDGELVAIKVPAKSRKVEGTLPYDKFITRIDFNDGLATVEEGHFVSNMMSFKLSGTTDFNTEKIDMTVKAAPGKHETDGIMPLTLKIGGTVSDPKGSMSVMRSVTSLVTQGVTNNFASRAVKNTVGGVFGLFKKKDKEENPETQDTPQTQEIQSPAEEETLVPAETTEAVTEP